jgi:hypothetical protein
MPRAWPRQLGYSLFLALAPFLLSGCGASKGTVTGEVKYKDKAVPNGKVTFYTEDGKNAKDSPIIEGRYTISDFPPGPAVITIQTFPPGKDSKGNSPSTSQFVKLPEKYASRTQTDQKYTVTAGSQTHNLDLK